MDQKINANLKGALARADRLIEALEARLAESVAGQRVYAFA